MMDDLGVPLFMETSICISTHMAAHSIHHIIYIHHNDSAPFSLVILPFYLAILVEIHLYIPIESYEGFLKWGYHYITQFSILNHPALVFSHHLWKPLYPSISLFLLAKPSFWHIKLHSSTSHSVLRSC